MHTPNADRPTPGPNAGGRPPPGSRPKPPARHRILRKLESWPHRYTLYRAASMTLTLGVLVAIPVSGLARFDLFGDEHRALGEKVSATRGFLAVSAGIAGFYVATFLLNLFLGRLFCGWGCPVAQISRFGERAQIAAGEPRRRVLIQGGLFALALAAAVLLWWVDPARIASGDVRVIGASAGILVGLVGLAWVHGRYWRWGFCKKLCPIGLYYTVVTAKETHGIAFDELLGTCKDCHACRQVCPVDLDPRHLDALRADVGGLSIDGLPAANHCLRCGDCVRTCEWIFRKESGAAFPLGFGLSHLGRPVAPQGAPPSGPPAAAPPTAPPSCESCGGVPRAHGEVPRAN